MAIVNSKSRASVDEIAAGIYRISTPLRPSPDMPAGFTFNQYLIADKEPLLYHTGLRRMFEVVSGAVETILPVKSLRHIAFSHVESDECGALNDFLAAAPSAAPLCGEIAAMVSIGDMADRPPRAMADGETVSLGSHRVTWIATPHLPHGWECGHLYEETTSTLFCGDLFTQFGAQHPPITEDDILEPSEAARSALDYYAHSDKTAELFEKLASREPRVLACMHGAAWRGDGAALLRALSRRLAA